MALWGGKDQANNSPLFGPSSVNKTPNETNRDALFENATPDAYIVGETVGVYGNQVTEAGPSGWVLKRIGSGGRAGRTFSEVLVAMGSIGPGDVIPSGESYWFNILNGDQTEYSLGVATDSLNNILINGITYSNTSGSADMIISKFNSSGDVQWQRLLGGINPEFGYGITTDSQNNIYVTGQTTSQGEGNSDLVIAKYNSSGVIQWQKILGSVGPEYGYGIAVDSQNNIYVTGLTNGDLLIVKYNSSGDVQWQKLLSGVNTEWGYGIAIDSQDNIYVTGPTDSQGAGNTDLLTVKYNSSGDIQWQRLLGGLINEEGYGIAIDSQNNIYVTGYTNSASAILIAKYNSSGDIQWQKSISGTGNNSGISIKADSNNNVYICGYSGGLSTEMNGFIVKLDSDGNLLFIRGIGTDPINYYNDCYGIIIDSNGNIIITGEHDGLDGATLYVGKLPNDGSLTGVYGDFNYYDGSSNLSISNVSLITNTATLVSNTVTLVSNTATLTDKAGNLVSTLITIS